MLSYITLINSVSSIERDFNLRSNSHWYWKKHWRNHSGLIWFAFCFNRVKWKAEVKEAAGCSRNLGSTLARHELCWKKPRGYNSGKRECKQCWERDRRCSEAETLWGITARLKGHERTGLTFCPPSARMNSSVQYRLPFPAQVLWF